MPVARRRSRCDLRGAFGFVARRRSGLDLWGDVMQPQPFGVSHGGNSRCGWCLSASDGEPKKPRRDGAFVKYASVVTALG